MNEIKQKKKKEEHILHIKYNIYVMLKKLIYNKIVPSIFIH